MNRNFFSFLLGTILLFSISSCSSTIENIVVSSMGNSLGNGQSTVFSGENDPELMGDAFPFMLKSLELMLSSNQEDQNIRANTVRAFTIYSSQWLELDAQMIEEDDYKKSKHLKKRAKNFYFRAKTYGLQGLEMVQEDFLKFLTSNPTRALEEFEKEDVPLLAWTALSWAALVNASPGEPETLGGIPRIASLMHRAYELDPDFDSGLLHEFFIKYYASGVSGIQNPIDKARVHYRRALELRSGEQCSPYVAWATSVSQKKQDKKEFVRLLDKALAIDVEKYVQTRLANKLCQKQARWLKSRIDDLFL